MVFSPRAPRGFVLSDLKWRPAVQTWVLWLHIKPFNHRAPCSTKKPLMRSLPRMNKQALMKKPEHFTQAKDMENKRKAEIWAIVMDSWVWIVSWNSLRNTSAGGKKKRKKKTVFLLNLPEIHTTGLVFLRVVLLYYWCVVYSWFWKVGDKLAICIWQACYLHLRQEKSSWSSKAVDFPKIFSLCNPLKMLAFQILFFLQEFSDTYLVFFYVIMLFYVLSEDDVCFVLWWWLVISMWDGPAWHRKKR